MCMLCGPTPAAMAIDHSIDHPFELKPDSDMECAKCDQHLSVHPDKVEYLRQRTINNILEHGQQIQYIFGDDGAPFFYTVGRAIKDRPELLLTGPLHPNDGMGILNALCEMDDETPFSAGDEVRLPGAAMAMRLVEVNPRKAEMNLATNLFGDEITALQVLWPDPEGHWPGDPEFKHDQPVIGV